MNPENNSRPPGFETGSLVVYRGKVCLVDHTSGKDSVHIMRWPNLFPFPVNERLVRGLRYREFIWFRHPITGNWMCGKTRGYMAVIIHMFALVLIVLGIATWGDGPTWTAIVIGAAILLGFWIGTRNNYTGKWK